MTDAKEDFEVGERPRWQLLAMLAVLLGCAATLFATLYDIA